MINSFPQVMTIAGSENDGAAGMQADLETFMHFKVYGASVVTACVAGNSYGVNAVQTLPCAFVAQEFKDLADDFKIRAVKTGMLANAALIQTVVNNYKRYDFGPLVVDPVIAGNNPNTSLLDPDALQILRQELLPLATIVTPNYVEAQKLTQLKIHNQKDMLTAAKLIQSWGAKNIMIKGPHHPTKGVVHDLVLLSNGHHFWLSGKYYSTTDKNGTGDTLSAGMVAELAKGLNVPTAIKVARQYVDKAIRDSLEIGHRYGPINHFVSVEHHSRLN